MKEKIHYIGWWQSGKNKSYIQEITVDKGSEFKGIVIQFGYLSGYRSVSKEKGWSRIDNPRVIYSKQGVVWEEGDINLDIKRDMKESKMNLRKIIREEINRLTESPKLTKGQQIWIRKKEDPEFVKGYVLDPNRPEIRSRQYDVVSGKYEMKDYIIRTEDPGPGPHRIIDPIGRQHTRDFARASRPSRKTKIPGALSDAQIRKLAKQFASGDIEIDNSVAYDLAQNLYLQRGVKEYLQQNGITNKNDAYEHLADLIASNI